MSEYVLWKEASVGRGFRPVIDMRTGRVRRFATQFAAMTWAEHEPEFVAAAYAIQEVEDDGCTGPQVDGIAAERFAL